jgi:predicted kinase
LIVVICGLPGVGKSLVAETLSKRLKKSVYINSDVVRKSLFGLSPYERVKPELVPIVYGRETSERVYEEIINKAIKEAKLGKVVILDATFNRKRYQEKLIEASQKENIPVKFYLLVASDETIRTRLKIRERSKTASDANYETYKIMKESFEKPNDCDIIDTEKFNLEEILKKIIREVSYEIE